jgi:putative ABC transport system permease protein
MAAIWMRVRSQLRSGLRWFIVLVVVTGIAAGVVLTAAAGARRTSSAYERFLAWARPPDAGGLVSTGSSSSVVDTRKVAALPEVRGSAVFDGFLFVPRSSSGRLSEIGQGAGSAAPALHPEEGLGRLKILEGTMLDPGDPHQILVGWGTGHLEEVHAGDRFDLRFLLRGQDPNVFFSANSVADIPASALGAPYPVTVAGIFFEPGDVGDNAYGDVLFSPAFDRSVGPQLSVQRQMTVRLEHGAADVDTFLHDVRALAGGGNVLFNSLGSTTPQVQRSIRPQAAALVIFAVLAAAAVLLALGQALARQTFLDSIENPTYRALGMTPGELFAAALAKSALLGIAAAPVAILTALALSRTMPVGLARVAEPAPGPSADWLVLGIGSVLVVIIVVAISAAPAWRAARQHGGALGLIEVPSPTRPSLTSRALRRLGLPPTAALGTRMALEPGRGRTSVPVRSAIVGLTLSIAALGTALGFGAGFDHLFSTPRLYGWNWDVALGSPYSVRDLAPKFVPALLADPDVGAVAAGNGLAVVAVQGPGGRADELQVIGLDQIRGTVHLPVLRGRWVRSDDEIVVGAKTLRRLGADIGGDVEIRAGERVRQARIVGTSAFLDLSGTGVLGQGVGMTLHALRGLYDGIPASVFPVRFRPGVNRGPATARLERTFPHAVVLPDPALGALEDVSPVRRVPLVLAAVLALAALTTMANTLVTSIRRRRRDLAILKTIGFVRRQVSSAVAWQASVMVAVSLAIGIPLGIAAGRWAWTAFADQLGVVPEPAVAAGAVLMMIPIALLAANLIALVPGRIAGKVRPAAALRTE